jgi:hypothetical protein
MGLPGHNCAVMSSGQACDKWSIEALYTGTSGAVALDTSTGEGGAWTDFDPRIPEDEAVSDSGTTGITNIRFPQSRRARVAHVSMEPATKQDADYRACLVTDIDAEAGTCKVYFLNASNAETDPPDGARLRLVLDLEYR